MQELSAQLRMDPQQRLTTIRGFAQKMKKADKETQVLRKWGMRIDANPVKFGARIFTPENIELGPIQQSGHARQFQYSVQDAVWTISLKDCKCVWVSRYAKKYIFCCGKISLINLTDISYKYTYLFLGWYILS